MKNLQTNLAEEEMALRIVEYLNKERLPEPLRQMLTQATTREEQDMLLLATLTAASACVPNLYFRYGPTGKRYYANLQCFILASAAAGKGIANQALDMVRVVDDEYPLLLAGDSTLPAFYKRLAAQGGRGYMHESEGSVITDIWKSGTMSYNTALRKAAEHEPISRNRVAGASEIKCPQLSMLLTGTFSQYRALVPNVENGYFSRLLTLVIRGAHPFEKRYVSGQAEQSAIPQQAGKRLLSLYEQLGTSEEREWSLTDRQKERLGEHLEKEYGTLTELLGENFHSVVLRMAVQIERIAMILTAMRMEPTAEGQKPEEGMPEDHPGARNTVILCSDEDYETAEMIGNKLLMHEAVAYRMIDGESVELVPKVKPLNQRKVLFEQLKPEYQLNELISEAKAQGISRRSAIRWNELWQDEGLIEKVKHGNYKKIA